MTTLPAPPGRRDRNMRDKQSRIFTAAAALFTEQGFERVTTQQISERADVAAGTLFRYAASKGELLLMVYNEEFRAALDAGIQAAASPTDPVEAVTALLRPILDAADRNVENSVVYQRELLFGSATDRYRCEGLALVAQLEEAIARRLAATARARGITDDRLDHHARHASRSVFAVLHLILARTFTGAHPDDNPLDDLHEQIAQIIAGYFDTVVDRTSGDDS
ncbi:TetR/AcrR family transcriptional regulator [Rhodococcus ruber]